MPPSAAQDSWKEVLLRYGYTVFYLKTFQCPNVTGIVLFFDSINDICTECPVPGCQTCKNISACQTCLTGYSLNITS